MITMNLILSLLFVCLGITAAEDRIDFTNFTNATISASPASSTKVVGSTVTLNCTASGHRPSSSSLQWYKGSDPSNPLPVNSTKVLNYRTTQLVFAQVTMEDAGYYTCALVLEDGRRNADLEDHARLAVGKLPSHVQNFTCYSRIPNQGFCEWDNPGDSNVNTHRTLQMAVQSRRLLWIDVECTNTAQYDSNGEQVECTSMTYAVQYDSNGERVECNNTVQYVSNGEHVKCALKNNDHADNFYYQVKSDNRFGKVLTESEPRHFSIYDDVIPYPPIDINLTAQTSDSMIVKWDHVPGLPPYRIINRLAYQIGDETNSEWTVIDLSEVNRFSVTYTITGLHPPYGKICVKLAAAENRIKVWGKWSDSVCEHLLEEKPAVKPVDIDYDVIDKNDNKGVKLYWKPLPEKKRNGKIIGYNIFIKNLNGNTSYRHTYTVPSEVNETKYEYEINGLNRTYTYDIEVVAFNGEGASPKATVTIDPSPPEATVTSDANQLPILAIVMPSVGMFLLLIVLLIYYIWKKLNKETYEVKLPEIVKLNNAYSKRFISPSFHVQESECYDELNPTQPNINPREKDHKKPDNMHGYHNFMNDKGDFPELKPLINAIGFDGGGKTRSELATVTEFLPVGNISQQYSPRSVGSGGSYWPGNENTDPIVYNMMTGEGLSPVNKCSPGGQWEDSIVGDNNDRVRSISDTAQSEMPSKTIMDASGRSISRDSLVAQLPNEKNPSSLTYSDGEIDSYVHQAQLTLIPLSVSSEQDKVSGDAKSRNKTDGKVIGATRSESPVADYVLSAGACTKPEIVEIRDLVGPVEDYVRCGALPENKVLNYLSLPPSPIDDQLPSPVIEVIQTTDDRVCDSLSYITNVPRNNRHGPQCMDDEQDENKDCIGHTNPSLTYHAERDAGYIPYRCIAGQLATSQDDVFLENHPSPTSSVSEDSYTHYVTATAMSELPKLSDTVCEPNATHNDNSETSASESGYGCRLSQTNSTEDELENGSVTINEEPISSPYISHDEMLMRMPSSTQYQPIYDGLVNNNNDGRLLQTNSTEDELKNGSVTINEEPVSPRYITHDEMLRRMQMPSSTQHQPICGLMVNNNDDIKIGNHAHDSNLSPSRTTMPMKIDQRSTRQLRRSSDDGYSSSYGINNSPCS